MSSAQLDLTFAAISDPTREAQWRSCRLEPAPLKDASDWIEHYRRYWEESFDRLDEYLHEVQSKEKTNGRKK